MITAPAIVATGLIGALIGSFLNVVVHRLPRASRWCGRARTAPPAAHRSALRQHPDRLLAGAARPLPQLPSRISARYPLVELLTAVAFAAWWRRGFDEDLLLELPLVAVLMAVAAIDLDHRIMPNRIVCPLARLRGLIATLLSAAASCPSC